MPEVVAQDCRNMRLAFGKSKKILTDTLQNAEGLLGGGRSAVLVLSVLCLPAYFGPTRLLCILIVCY